MNSQRELIREAVIKASLDPSISMYQLTVKEVDLIAHQINKTLEKEGLTIMNRFKININEGSESY